MQMRTSPRGGEVWGGIRAGFGFSFFGGADIMKEKYITLKSRQSRDTKFALSRCKKLSNNFGIEPLFLKMNR